MHYYYSYCCLSYYFCCYLKFWIEVVFCLEPLDLCYISFFVNLNLFGIIFAQKCYIFLYYLLFLNRQNYHCVLLIVLLFYFYQVHFHLHLQIHFYLHYVLVLLLNHVPDLLHVHVLDFVLGFHHFFC